MQTIEKQCPYCGKYFEWNKPFPSTREKKYCSRACAMRLRLESKEDPIWGQPWSEPELKLLRSWVGKKHPAQAIRDYLAIALKRGWAERSDEAINLKFKRLAYEKGESSTPKQDNWTMRQLCRLLDVTKQRVQVWIRKGLQKEVLYAQSKTSKYAIARSNLVEFARSHPEQFGGIDPRRLSKVLGDAKIARIIAQSIDAPPWHQIVVVRLDNGAIYPSIKAAALDVGIHSETISKNTKRDRVMKNGMEWARLDYPLYWVPSWVRSEFNREAGRLLHEMYLQLRELDGYSKTSCVIVAGRMAVQIALLTFRRREKLKYYGEELSPFQTMTQFWQDRFMENLKHFLPLSPNLQLLKLTSAIKRVAYITFACLLPKISNREMDEHLENFALYHIERLTNFFYRKSYLPLNYQPSNKLEIADFIATIYGYNIVKIEFKNDRFQYLTRLQAFNYITRKLWKQGSTADLSGTGLDEEDRDRSYQYYAQTQAITPANNDAAQLLEDLVEWIGRQPIEEELRDRYSLYIAMKLEDASNKEIAEAMRISEAEVAKLEQKLRQLAVQFNHVPRTNLA